jgi:hypothetical protein
LSAVAGVLAPTPGAAKPRRAAHLHVLLAIARADFLERVRCYGFLITLTVAAWGVHGALPRRGAGYTTVSLDGHRALYGSAGAATIVALITGLFLTLAGFYLVKNAVERDRHTGVGPILAATRVGRLTYIAGKVLSNAAVLFAMLGVMLVVAGVMQQVLGEDRHVAIGALALPFVLLAAPAMLVVSAMAVLFEVVPRLRGGLGNVVFFFLWAWGLATAVPGSVVRLPIGDAVGMTIAMPSLEQACARAFPDYHPGKGRTAGVNFSPRAHAVTPFAYAGVRWTPALLAQRLAWVAFAALLTLLAAALFDRFDTARAAPGRQGRRRARAHAAGDPASGAAEPATPARMRGSVAALTPALRSERFAPLLRVELALLLKGQGRWWYAGALAFALVCLLVPLAGVRSVALPLTVIWPLLAWSSLGWREQHHGVAALLFSAPRPLRRQLLATWLAGVLLALAASGTYGLRVALAGDAGSLTGWLAGVLFIPSLALACGVWTGSGKLFQVGFLALWYVGPMQRVAALDVLGAVPGARAAHATFFALALALLALAYAGRARQLRG